MCGISFLTDGVMCTFCCARLRDGNVAGPPFRPLVQNTCKQVLCYIRLSLNTRNGKLNLSKWRTGGLLV